MMHTLKANKVLLIILLGAFVLRVIGLQYALPQFFVNDERALVYGGLTMLELRTAIPALHPDEFRILNYPVVPSYLYAFILAPTLFIQYVSSGLETLSEFRDALAFDPTIIFVVSRLFNALLGVVSVFLTYLIGKRMFHSRTVGLFASLFMALSFLHIQVSHVTRHWIPALVFLLLVWYAAMRLYDEPKTKWYVWGGIFSALAIGSNPSAAIALFPLVILHFVKRRSIFDKRLWVLIGVAVVLSAGFVALHPYGYTLGEGLGSTLGESLTVRLGEIAQKSFVGLGLFLWQYIQSIFQAEPMLFLFALGGGVLMFIRERKWLFVFLGFSFMYFGALYYVFNFIFRAALFVIPLCALMAGYFADALFERSQSRISRGFILLAVIVVPLVVGLRYDVLLTRSDTRLVAAEWVHQNVSPGESILAYLPYLRLTNTHEGIERMQSFDPQSLRASDRALLNLSSDTYPEARTVINSAYLSNPTAVNAEIYNYVIIEYLDSQSVDHVRSFIENRTLVQRFSPWQNKAATGFDIRDEINAPLGMLFQIDRFGPVVEVYR